MVLDVAVGREQRPVGRRRHAQRMLLLAAVHGRDEDARRVELMAAQLGHQAGAGAVPEPPADQFLDRRPVVDHLARGVLDLHRSRSRTSRRRRSRRPVGPRPAPAASATASIAAPRGRRPIPSRYSLQLLDQLLGQRIVRLDLRRHRLLPTVLARQIAAVPLGADVVQIAQHAAPDRVDRVGVEDVVVPLVAGGQDAARSARPRGPSPCTRGRCGP